MALSFLQGGVAQPCREATRMQERNVLVGTLILAILATAYPVWMGVANVSNGQTRLATIAFVFAVLYIGAIVIIVRLLWKRFPPKVDLHETPVSFPKRKLPIDISGSEFPAVGSLRGLHQQGITIVSTGLAPMLTRGQSPNIHMIVLHVCNRLDRPVILKHLTCGIMLDSYTLRRDWQKILDQEMAPSSCTELGFTIEVNNVPEQIQMRSVHTLSLAGKAVVSIAGKNFDWPLNLTMSCQS